MKPARNAENIQKVPYFFPFALQALYIIFIKRKKWRFGFPSQDK